MWSALRRFGAGPVAATVAAAAASLAPAEARACKRSLAPKIGDKQACLFWPRRQVAVTINSAGTRDVVGTAEFDAVRRSFATWSRVPGSDFALLAAGFTSDVRVGFFANGGVDVNQVLWRAAFCADVVPPADACWTQGGCGNKYACWEQPRDTIAITTTTFSNKCGELYDGDIELNDAGFLFTIVDSPPCPGRTPTESCVATDVENTVTHELGHLAGLDHSDDPEATMFYSAPQGETRKRDLAADDIECFTAMYPTQQPPAVCVACEPKQVTGGCCGGTNAAATPLLLLAAAAGARGPPRRRWGARR